MPEEQMTPSAFLLGELRRARSAAGLSQEDLGKSINYSGSQVSAVETGQRPPTRDYLVAVDGALGTGGLFERVLSELVGLDQAPVWFRDWLIIEREATLIRWFEPSIVPGLLQTETYAHAVIAGSGMVDPAEIEQRVVTRMERQRVLSSLTPPTLIALIDEGVLRRVVGDPKVMVRQCEHLLECAEESRIQVHVVPASAGSYAGLAGPFILAKGRDFEAAHLDTPWQAQIVGRRDAVDSLIKRWEAIRGEALPWKHSIDLIKEVAESWKT
ncbi:transcriptional regulator with XRE-family HTH domain [Actinoplanes tereljensis]|uniref:Transcriptional regulator n=1 Tax=Paractinoplanes tereljensis TaxID=571912 RepID=A0A919NJE8_9ACTN|nr:helix-turn-helix transcriptional regulator [Actinoplanes tereljensis]GIF19288.1 transcriptional regulator [Actinoplanes tereljensis]